jgi:hypothetical protein
MNEVKFLIDQIKTTFNGDSWHGPNMIQTLKGVNKDVASKRRLSERHTIWELTNHNTYWIEEVTKSVKAKKDLYLGGDAWPKMGETEEDWENSVKRLEAVVNMLVNELASWSNEDLAMKVGKTSFTYKVMLHGLIHHNLYHAGQINILKNKEK